MKVLLQFSFILILLKISQVIGYYINPFINIPEAILALVMLFLLLHFKVIKLDHVSGISNILLQNMALFFAPLGVKIITQLELISGNVVSIAMIVILSTIITLTTTSLVAKFMIIMQQKVNERRCLNERNTD